MFGGSPHTSTPFTPDVSKLLAADWAQLFEFCPNALSIRAPGEQPGVLDKWQEFKYVNHEENWLGHPVTN